MEKPTTAEVRGVAAVIGPGGILGLLIASGTDHAVNITTALWWRISMGFAAAVTLWLFAALVLPHTRLRFRLPWYVDSDSLRPANNAEIANALQATQETLREALAQRDAALLEVAALRERANPTKLKDAARLLAKEIRAFADDIEAGRAHLDADAKTYIDLFMPRYKAIKERMEAELPNFSVNSWAHWWPNSLGNLRKIAKDLDDDARRVDDGALL